MLRLDDIESSLNWDEVYSSWVDDTNGKEAQEGRWLNKIYSSMWLEWWEEESWLVKYGFCLTRLTLNYSSLLKMWC